METTGSRSDSLQLRPFPKMKTSLKGKNSLRSEFYPLRAVPYSMENHFYTLGDLP